MGPQGKLKLGAAALVLLFAFALLLVAANLRSRDLRADDGATTASVRSAALAALARVDAAGAPSWQDARGRLRTSVQRLADEPYVAYVWLIRSRGAGRISYSSGGTGREGDDIVDLAGVVGEAALTSEKWSAGRADRLVPIAAAAMARDGDHRDVLRYLAVPVDFADGDGALVAVAYDRTPAAGNPGFVYQALLGAAGAFGLLGVFVALTAWRKPAPVVS